MLGKHRKMIKDYDIFFHGKSQHYPNFDCVFQINMPQATSVYAWHHFWCMKKGQSHHYCHITGHKQQSKALTKMVSLKICTDGNILCPVFFHMFFLFMTLLLISIVNMACSRVYGNNLQFPATFGWRQHLRLKLSISGYFMSEIAQWEYSYCALLLA